MKQRSLAGKTIRNKVKGGMTTSWCFYTVTVRVPMQIGAFQRYIRVGNYVYVFTVDFDCPIKKNIYKTTSGNR